jgi:hypothetical protein
MSTLYQNAIVFLHGSLFFPDWKEKPTKFFWEEKRTLYQNAIVFSHGSLFFPDWKEKPTKFFWEETQIEFDGIPYMSYGRVILDCHHGHDRNKGVKLNVDRRFNEVQLSTSRLFL